MTTLTVADTQTLEAEVAITVYGQPAPQGSKRHVGHGVMLESSKKLKPWREAVKQSALDTLHPWKAWDILSSACAVCAVGHDLHTPLDRPLLVDMIFTFARPRGHFRTGRNAHLLRDTAPTRPSGVPDLSKLARSTEDALTDAGAWADDARVVEYGRLAKVYANSGDPDALHIPGAVIRIRPLTTHQEGPDA